MLNSIITLKQSEIEFLQYKQHWDWCNIYLNCLSPLDARAWEVQLSKKKEGKGFPEVTL